MRFHTHLYVDYISVRRRPVPATYLYSWAAAAQTKAHEAQGNKSLEIIFPPANIFESFPDIPTFSYIQERFFLLYFMVHINSNSVFISTGDILVLYSACIMLDHISAGLS